MVTQQQLRRHYYYNRLPSFLFMIVMCLFIAVASASTPPLLKEQTEEFERYRSQISRQKPHVSSDTAEMEIVYPKKLGPLDNDKSLSMRVGGAVRLHRSQREAASVPVDEAYNNNATGSSQLLNIQMFRIRAFNRDFLLTVNPRETFLAPNFVVQHLSDNSTWLSQQQQQQQQQKKTDEQIHLPPNWQRCFYSGIVNYERDSNVALSLCRGMFGIFRFKDSNYFIEPYSAKRSAFAGNSTTIHDRPHLIYKFKTATKSSTNQTTEVVENGTISSLNLPVGRSRREVDQFDVNQIGALPSDFYQNYPGRRRRKVREQLPPGEQHRVQRSTSRNHYVELMIAADYRMRDYHGSDSALEAYILTLMAVVASVYRDPSIGNPIHVLLMKIIIVHNEKDGPVMSQQAPAMLQSFCQWQHRYNDPDPLSPNHYDAAILLTRHDICRRSEKCDTLGLAEMGTICDREKSCAVVEDNGLSAAFTIIHELGHLFNLPHDSDVRCRQFSEQANGIYHVMAPTLDFNTNPWSWSQCSRKHATEFLDNEHGYCLWNIPSEMELQRRLDSDYTHFPGVTYDTNFQCQLVFGQSSRVCPYMPVCKRLWCTADIGEADGCRTQHMPWADGTSCGHNRWCIKGECVAKDGSRPESVDGQWSGWSSYGPCSRTCGGGIKTATRTCNNPPPSNGGKFCLGERQKFKSCNTKECLPSTQDFREEQCAKYNGDTSRAERLPQNVFWVPKYDVDARQRCKLYCEAFGTGISVLMENQVIDGTKCGPDTTDICVGGICHPAGCDNKLYSNAQFDMCGVCAGDNSTCAVVEDSFVRHMKYGYNEIITVPKGAANIDIQQIAINSDNGDENYLAIRGSGGEYLLNGNFLVNGFRREIRVRGAVIEYSGSHNNIERLNTTSRIGEELHILVLAVGSLQPAKIHYKWYMSDKSKLHYKWRVDLGEWSQCDRICQGLRYLQPRCAPADSDDVVEDHFCFGQEQPPAKSEVCNADCQLTWMVSRQSRCSVTCGEGIVRRQYACAKISLTRGLNETVTDENCESISHRPREEGPCTMPPCYQEPVNDWEYSAWGQCSTTCGRGYRSRKARCVNVQTGREQSQTKCDRRRKQLTDDICEGPPCLTWKMSEWEQCSATCGRGIRHRHVHCDSDGVPVDDHKCNQAEKPVEQEDCPDLPACPRWQVGNWSACSATCGLGTETRPVWCAEGESVVVNDETCSREGAKPDTERRCEGGDCPFWRTGPWTQCSKSCGQGSVRRREIWCTTREQAYDFVHCPPDTMPTEVEPCAMPECPAWIASEWSKCSKTCGIGQRFRNVSCLPIEHRDKCDRTTKPDPVEDCHLNDCSEWHVGDWSPCSTTCGSTGAQFRTVKCRLGESEVDEAFCDRKRPNNTRPCPPMGSCPNWHMTIWGPCSVTCGPGLRRRSVVCRNETVLFPHSACSPQPMPADTQACSNGECASWVVGDWSPCSIPCHDPAKPSDVPSVRTREVSCALSNGVTIPPVRCHLQKKPVERQHCKNIPACLRIGYSDWSPCSTSCGEGVRHRKIVCYNGNEAVEMERCSSLVNASAQLPLIETCILRRDCPGWVSGKWSPCSNACGSGEQKRDVWCELDGRLESDFTCDQTTKPPTWQHCWGDLCPTWAFSKWDTCSQSCGYGIQGRQVWCQLGNHTSTPSPDGSRLVPSTDSVVNPHLCQAVPRPPSFQPCIGYECPVWFATNFTECNAACGGGQQYRSVFCVLNNSLPLPALISDSSKILAETLNILQIDRCDSETKPETAQACNLQSCSNWSSTDWDECIADKLDENGHISCGVMPGSRRREVYCQDIISQLKLPDESCANEPRPPELESCSTEVKCTTVMVDDGASLVERSAKKRIHPSQRKLALKHFVDSTNDLTIGNFDHIGVTQSTETAPTTPTLESLILQPKSIIGNENPVVIATNYAWQATGWSNCSALCGTGATRQRLFSCFNTVLGQVVDNSYCETSQMPTETNQCVELSACPHWLARDWTPCSTTCGRGVQTRPVQCIDPGNDNAAVADTRCEKKTRPKAVRYCLGPAGLCIGPAGPTTPQSYSSNSTGTANQQNYGQLDTSKIPAAEWRVGPWGQSSFRFAVPQRKKNLKEFSSCCKNLYHIQCSVTCGSGIQVRRVVCIIRRQAHQTSQQQMPLTQTAPQRCPPNVRPSRTRRCQAPETCPEWDTEPWSECSVTCGIGHHHRSVTCDAASCHGVKPDVVETCIEPCWTSRHHVAAQRSHQQPLFARFEWEIGEWQACSVPCDYGVKHRRVVCTASHHHLLRSNSHLNKRHIVADILCETRYGGKPMLQQSCYEKPCKSTWLAGEWSPCSNSCGYGSQHRLVTCYSLQQNATSSLIPTYRTVFKPKLAEQICGINDKPDNFRQCRVMSSCSNSSTLITANYITWTTGPWSQCSRSCSFGIKQRQVSCVEYLDGDKTRILPEVMCYHMNITKPENSLRCFERNCVAKSCRHALKSFNATLDGYYEMALSTVRLRHHHHQKNTSFLLPHHVNAYCNGMMMMTNASKHQSPKEYLDVVDFEQKQTSFRCPFNGTSTIVFHRIRFIPSAMILSFGDWTFANAENDNDSSFNSSHRGEVVIFELLVTGVRHVVQSTAAAEKSAFIRFACRLNKNCKNSCSLLSSSSSSTTPINKHHDFSNKTITNPA